MGAVNRPLVIPVPEAAKLLGIGRNTAYEAVARGEIPSIRIGRRLLVPVAALERFLGIDSEPPSPAHDMGGGGEY
jgi:excisionase family DNA binding protein